MINTIKRALNLYYKSYKQIQERRSLLFSGKYRLCYDNGRYIWKSEMPFFWWLRDQLFNSENFTKTIIRILLLKNTCLIYEDGKCACGDWLYISRKGNTKVFNHKNMTVTYFPKEEKDLDVALRFKKEYSVCYGTPIIEKVDYNNHCIVERLISEDQSWRNNQVEVERAIKWVLESSVKYLKMATKKEICAQDFVSSIKKNRQYTDVEFLIDEIVSNCDIGKEYIILVNQHNDIVLSNLLKEDNSFTVFDYEFFQENIFYYDAMMLIMWEALHYQHDKYLEDYLTGEYDILFESIFDSTGVYFNKMKRAYYAQLFLIANVRIHLLTGDKTNVDNYMRVLSILKKQHFAKEVVV